MLLIDQVCLCPLRKAKNFLAEDNAITLFLNPKKRDSFNHIIL